MKYYFSVAAFLFMLALTSCGSITRLYSPGALEIQLVEYNGTPSSTFSDMDKPVRVTVNRALTDASIQMPFSQDLYTPPVNVFAKTVAEKYMDAMGFEVSPSADYVLEISAIVFDYNKVDNHNASYHAQISYSLLNEAGENVVPVNSANGYVTLSNSMAIGVCFGRAYFEALQKINWNRIAKPLTVQNSPKKEKNKAVSGDGDTALEHTVIRWNILSRPGGADVSWRVVSSTADVQNTNSNYVGSTPYESTESFDIKGLTYNNSGNVQIEVTCERSGYLPQKKRFNLRQAIDQKEISAMFNLVKDE